jgi:hypothetical protein
MKLGRLASFALILLTGSFLAAPASAQTEGDVLAGVAGLYAISSTSAGLTTTVGGIILTVVLTKNKRKKAMMWYIRQNSVALKQEVTIGGGTTVADIGQLFGTNPGEYEAFANALQTKRRELVALIGTEPIDDVRTEQFVDSLWEAVATDEALASALAERYVEGG